MLAPDAETEVPRSETIERLRKIVAPLPGHAYRRAGDGRRRVWSRVEDDGRRLGWASTVLLGATIIACFRSLRWVLLPIAVVQLTLLLTRAILAWSGIRLSMVSSMLTAIVTVVGVGTMIHIIVRFREARLRGLKPQEALGATLVLLAVPGFWSLATDAVGFGSLLLNRVGPIRDFGVMMAIGSLLVLVSLVLLLPGLALVGPLDRDPHRAWGESHLDAALQGMIHACGVGHIRLASPSLVISAVAIAGIAFGGGDRLHAQFRASSPIVRSYAFVESNLGGRRMGHHPSAPAEPRLGLSSRVRHLEDRLREVTTLGPDGVPPGLTKVLSSDARGGLEREPDQVPLAAVRDAPPRTGLKMVAAACPFLRGPSRRRSAPSGPVLPSGDARRMNVSRPGRSEHLIAQVEQISREEFPPTTDSEGRPGDRSSSSWPT